MKTPLERIRLGAIVFAVILVVATIGYRFTGRDWVNSLYMVVITVTSVGYGDSKDNVPPWPEQLFTIVVVAVGMTAGAYTIGGLLQMMTEGEIDRALGRRRITQEIERLTGHVIICGYGRIGQILAHDLRRQKVSFVVIENNPERVTEASDERSLVLSGDATEEAVLKNAGVERAKTLITALNSDANNVFITLTARNLNKGLQIIARAEFRSSEKKLKQAGADRVVLPAAIGAKQMSRMITRPTTADFIELISDTAKLHLEMDEIRVSPGGSLVGVSVAQAETHRRHKLLVIAIQQAGGEMVFNPGGDYIFQEGDTLIVMGREEDIARFEKQYGLTR